MKYRPKHIAEYVLLRSMAGFVNIIPYRAAMFIGWINTLIAFYVIRYRVGMAKSRIRAVFGDKYTEKEINRIAWLSLLNISLMIIEMLRVHRVDLAWLRRHTNFSDCIDDLKSKLSETNGGIVAVPHTGNWELAAVALHLHGFPIFTVVANQSNPLTTRYLQKLRHGPGIDTVVRGDGAMKSVLARLRAGELVAMLPDVRAKKKGVSVPFLGGVANIPAGMASFARHANVPIVACAILRHGWATTEALVLDPIVPDPSIDKRTDIERMTKEVMKILDGVVQKNPEQWFWFNKRWILDPPDE